MDSAARTGGTGVGYLAKFLGSDFFSIQSNWSTIIHDSWIGMWSDKCGSPWLNCSYWYDHYCPNNTTVGYAVLPTDVPNGMSVDYNCWPGLLPANMSQIQFMNYSTTSLQGIICEFGKETKVILFC